MKNMLGPVIDLTKRVNWIMLTVQQDYFKMFMGFPTTGGAAPPEKK